VALHQAIQRLLLLGARLESFAPCHPPTAGAVGALVEAIEPEHRRFDRQAVHFGASLSQRFWAIYLLSASQFYVLCCRWRWMG